MLERMLQRMFVGVSEGMHDRILDYGKAVTGSTFFALSVEFGDGLVDGWKVWAIAGNAIDERPAQLFMFILECPCNPFLHRHLWQHPHIRLLE